jgi:hypothetical protein
VHHRADIIRFAATFFILSAVLGWVFSVTGALVGTYSLDVNMLAVPAVSAMFASIGFSWRRKLVYGSATLALYILSGMVAEFAGLNRLASERLATSASFPPIWINLYLAFLITFPFVMLVLFVGRRPALLWSRRAD